MTSLRAALDASDGDEFTAAPRVMRRCRDPLFRAAVITELVSELQAEAPTLRGLGDEAEDVGEAG